MRFIVAAGLALSVCGAASGQSVGTQAVVASGLARPLYMISPPGELDRLFVVEQWSGSTGRIRIYKRSTGTIQPTNSPFFSLSVSNGNEQGLLGLAFHPQFATNRKFYVYFTKPNTGAVQIREYQASASNPDVADLTTARDILTFAKPQTNHNGGWLAFGPDGYLYAGTGDGGNGNDQGTGHVEPCGNAQDTSAGQMLGKILRIDINRDDFPNDTTKNYGIPADNPQLGRGFANEVWAFGVRNPWRNSFDRVTNELWIGDVGQGAYEEIDRQPAGVGGQNYGWRTWEANNNTGLNLSSCSGIAVTFPVYNYDHSAGRCSMTGGYVYRGCAIPSLYGKYVFGDYCTGEVWALDTTSYVATKILTLGAGLTSFAQDNYGELYYTLNSTLVKIVPVGSPFLDCNGNARPDCWDILDGLSKDVNHDGIPDECQNLCPADFNGDGFLDIYDFSAFVSCFEGASCPSGKTSDFNADGFADIYDFVDFVSAFERGCP